MKKNINMRSKNILRLSLVKIVLSVAIIISTASAQNRRGKLGNDIKPLLDANNVTWDVPGPTSSQSMPIGNGDIGLNVWVEPNGDLNFYISKTDTWGVDVKSARGLMKVGGVRVSLSPNPLTAGTPFMQSLRLNEGEILIKEGNGLQMHVWVDANNPVIRVETSSKQPVAVKVTLNDWRLQGGGDTLISGKNNITWYHRNPATPDKHVAGLTFGALIKGKGLVGKNDTTLLSGAATSHVISVFPLTAQTSLSEWRARLNKNIAAVNKLPLEQTRIAHQRWWDKFWHRSWIFFSGNETAVKVNQGYVLQRFVTACAGRGAYPIKFNGSIFVVDNPGLKEAGGKKVISVDADFRTWGGQYWFQNTRPMYWPMLEQGNFDMMMPLFKMYAKETVNNKIQVENYYHHDGSYFAETAPFYGSLRYWGPEVKEDWTGHYFTPILELSMMMLDYYEFTGDKKFAKEMLVPVASEGLEFFDKHFSRDAHGKLLLDPDNAIEQYWKVHDPAPDIAGLNAITTRMLALPADLTDEKSRQNWKRLLGELPPLPKGIRNGKEVLFPYTTDSLTAKPRNNENPELYAIYPFRLYGLDKPGLQLAINSFNERLKHTQKGCWVQDPIQAAMLGLTDIAQTYVSFNFQRKDPQLKFPAFWAGANDYAPDEDNGGCGEHGLQEMLMQTDGKKIMLLPAWPKEWGDVNFKLHAPYNTTVSGKVKNCKLTELVVIPASRKQDVIDVSIHQVQP
jgi:alpha-L-fucosidase 2